MRHTIHAWLEQGEPRLGIIDQATGQVRQLWRLDKIESGDTPPEPADTALTMQQLARKLFLISCCQSIAQATQQSDSADCRHCLQRSQCDANVAGAVNRLAKSAC